MDIDMTEEERRRAAQIKVRGFSNSYTRKVTCEYNNDTRVNSWVCVKVSFSFFEYENLGNRDSLRLGILALERRNHQSYRHLLGRERGSGG